MNRQNPSSTLIRLDNAAEFTSSIVEISVEHPVAYVYIQNGLAKFLIKRLQLIVHLLYFIR